MFSDVPGDLEPNDWLRFEGVLLTARGDDVVGHWVIPIGKCGEENKQQEGNNDEWRELVFHLVAAECLKVWRKQCEEGKYLQLFISFGFTSSSSNSANVIHFEHTLCVLLPLLLVRFASFE